MGVAQSWYSNQCACGEIASNCALSSGWLASGESLGVKRPQAAPLFLSNGVSLAKRKKRRAKERSEAGNQDRKINSSIG